MTWKKRMKDAGEKAKRTRLLRARAKKAVTTRRANQFAQQQSHANGPEPRSGGSP